jgi:DNA-binding beta-propeller fold protein YncE
MRRLSALVRLSVIALLLALAVLGLTQLATTEAQNETMNEREMAYQEYEGKVRAPEFPEGLDWINTDRPLTMAELRGKVVLLDFWTYGCINCMHVIPDLHKLEAEFPNELVVIGVHSAKFTNEGNTANIRNITQRYGVIHPVVNDKDFKIWQSYGVRAWPTAMLIDPAGKVLGYHAGEGVYQVLQPVIKGMVEAFNKRGQIDARRLEFGAGKAVVSTTGLLFPGKVLADAAGGRLFISDSNHNRIVIADLKTFAVQAVIGSGQEGLTDGDYATAAFYKPQGMTLNDAGTVLYVTDTSNHALRAIDLSAKTVKTIAGDGNQAAYRTRLGAKAAATRLSSPWDVVFVNDVLYIAMAGPHQLWRLDLKADVVEAHAGSGSEGLLDGALDQAQLAQPSGIATDGMKLYFADSESSAIRTADVAPDGVVGTIVGLGLFDFGDRDGRGSQVLLQHPLGVTVTPDGTLYIADTYNSKIKRIEPQNFTSTTVFGSESGLADGNGTVAKFNEPGGLSYADGKLYIADTNNHLIRVIDLATSEVTTVVFPNPEALGSAPNVEEDVFTVDLSTPDPEFFGTVVKLDPVQAAPGQGQLSLDFVFPDGYKVNNLAPFTLVVYNTSEVAEVVAKDNDLRIVEPTLPLTVPITLRAGTSTLIMDTTVVYCEAVNPQVCFFSTYRFEVPLTVTAEAAKAEVNIKYTITLPKPDGSAVAN